MLYCSLPMLTSSVTGVYVLKGIYIVIKLALQATLSFKTQVYQYVTDCTTALHTFQLFLFSFTLAGSGGALQRRYIRIKIIFKVEVVSDDTYIRERGVGRP